MKKCHALCALVAPENGKDDECIHMLFCFFVFYLDVGGFFEAGTLIQYNFLLEAIAGASQDSRILTHQLTSHEVNLTKEEVALSFSTSSSPAILMYISSKTQEYLALVLRQNGNTHWYTTTNTGAGVDLLW